MDWQNVINKNENKEIKGKINSNNIKENPNVHDIKVDEIKTRIALLSEEKKVLLEQNKILKKSTPSMEFISQKQGNAAFEAKVKKVETIRNSI